MEVTDARELVLDNAIFRKIGRDVSVLPPYCEPSLEDVPVRVLSVSNRFGLTFIAHVTGFSVARTEELVKLAENSEENAHNLLEKCIATISLPNIHIIELSKDELTLAVCVKSQLKLFDIPTLVLTSDATPKEYSVKSNIKDFRWCDNSTYLLLDEGGELLVGSANKVPKSVQRNVSAVSWSPDGKHVAYMVDMLLKIASCDFTHSFTVDVLSKLESIFEGSELHADSLYWISQNCMLLSFVQFEDGDGNEEVACPLVALSSTEGVLSQENAVLVAVTFPIVFPAVDPEVVPSGTGPYMLLEYMEYWKLVLTTCKRSTDEHVVILGWGEDMDVKESICSFVPSNDAWKPYIPMSDYFDENALIGLAVDRTSRTQHPDPTNVQGQIPPSPILMCFTLDGKLCLFNILRLKSSLYTSETMVSPLRIEDFQPEAKKISEPLSKPADKNKSNNANQELAGTSPKRDDSANATVNGVPSAPVLGFSASKTVNSARKSLDLNQSPQQTAQPVAANAFSQSASVTSTTPLFSQTVSVPQTRAAQPSPSLKSAPPTDTPTLTKQSSVTNKPIRSPGVSDMEADFLMELQKVRKISDEVDGFIASIENSVGKSFSRDTVERLEENLSLAMDECKALKRKLEEDAHLVEELRDQTLQVDAWRIYVQSLVEQAADTQYQDLWVHQKLHPEMEIKRKHVFNAYESLKEQISELETHLCTLELSRQQNTRKQVSTPRQLPSIQCLYNTVNAQMDVAEQLCNRLAEQMDLLKISPAAATSSTPHHITSSTSTPVKNILKSLGLSPDTVQSSSTGDLTLTASESTRRRRDSMDSAWAGVGVTKTTIKRVSHVKPKENVKPKEELAIVISDRLQNGIQKQKVPYSMQNGIQKGVVSIGTGTGTATEMRRKVLIRSESSARTVTTSTSHTGLSLSNKTEQVPARSLMKDIENASSDSTNLNFAGPYLSQVEIPVSKQKISSQSSIVATCMPFSGTEAQVQIPVDNQKSMLQPKSPFSLTGTSLASSTQKSTAISPFQTSPFTAKPEPVKHSSSPFFTTSTSAEASSTSALASSVQVGSQSGIGVSSSAYSNTRGAQVPPKTQEVSLAVPSQTQRTLTYSQSSEKSITASASSPFQSAQTSTVGSQGSSSKPQPVPSLFPSQVSSSSSTASTLKPTTGIAQAPSSSPSQFPITSLSSQPSSTGISLVKFPGPSSSSQSSTGLSPFQNSSSPQGGFFSASSSSSSSSNWTTAPTTTSSFAFPALQQQQPNFQPASMSLEEDMEEASIVTGTNPGTNPGTGTGAVGFNSFGGLGLGGATPSVQKALPFGVSSMPPSSPFGQPMSAPSGQLFRPAAFSLPPASSPATATGTITGSSSSSAFGGFGTSSFGQSPSSPFGQSFQPSAFSFQPVNSPATPPPHHQQQQQQQQGGAFGGSGFPSQLGPGQQALGSALGSFGQTRQLGAAAAAAAVASPSSSAASGFGGGGGGGFASAATGGGFAGAASSTGGGFQAFAQQQQFPSSAFGATTSSSSSANFTVMRR